MNKLGFGFLRPPRKDRSDSKSIHWEKLCELVDAFLAAGGDYFDTAYTYLGGMSEEAIRRCVVERHPRESFRLADKLPGYKVKAPEDCERFFEEMCRRCGVTWFDVFLLHWLNGANYAKAEEFDEFGFLRRLKREGRAKKIGFSYHGSAVLLEEILSAHPEVDIVQLQINYLDWDDPAIEAGACYRVAERHGKEVVVMEPVKGGTLADLPEEAAAILAALAPEESAAAWAIRFAADLDAVSVVLSGMNTMEQLRDNQRDFAPLGETERAALREVAALLNRSIAVPCTACRYCVSHCPQRIPIPDYFAILNSFERHKDDGWKMQPVYESLARGRGKASECLACRACEGNCPQGIRISEVLPRVAEAMEG